MAKRRNVTEQEVNNILFDENANEEDDLEELNGGEEAGWIDEDTGDEDGPGEDETSDSGDSGGEIEENEETQQQVPTRRKRRIRLKDRLVHSLDTALDASNYDPYEPPEEDITETSVMEKPTKDTPGKRIEWQNFPVARSTAGRPPAVQQRKVVREL